MKKLVIIFLMAATIVSSCACQSKPSVRMNLDWTPYEAQAAYRYEAVPSQNVTLSNQGMNSILTKIKSLEVYYPYSHLYELDEVKNRLDFDASVDTHVHGALNENGELDPTYLAKLVEKNNIEYLKSAVFGFENVDKEYVLDICNLIVEVVTHMKEKYPDVDWDRVYCNLGDLKILYDTGMLSYAQVNKDLVLAISKNNTEIVLTMKGENGLRDVLIHETIHLIQIGCQCEDIENCERRCGISVYWDDFPLNTTDWGWLFEGSAEKYMCALTGDKAISYQYKMDYVCSFTMSTLLRDNVKSDTMESLSFYSDPNLLFEVFGCETESEKEEVLNMMITMNILQMQPERFYEIVEKETGVNPSESDEALDQFSYELKPAVCTSLAKEFYENLAIYLHENGLTIDDLCFLINVFEGNLNQHLRYNNVDNLEINAPFFNDYNVIRSAFFDIIEAENPGIDMDAYYNSYEILSDTNTLNAQLTALPLDKKLFIAERVKWQAELNGVGEKVPL